MLKLAQRSTDELFSIALYNWLIQADLADKLLQVSSSIHSELGEVIVIMLQKTGKSKSVTVIFLMSPGYCPIFGTLPGADDQD